MVVVLHDFTWAAHITTSAFGAESGGTLADSYETTVPMFEQSGRRWYQLIALFRALGFPESGIGSLPHWPSPNTETCTNIPRTGRALKPSHTRYLGTFEIHRYRQTCSRS